MSENCYFRYNRDDIYKFNKEELDLIIGKL